MERETIYMPLLDEGTDVWRPVYAEPLGGGRYRVLGELPDLEDEVWAFPPGSIVRCQKKVFSEGDEGLVAVETAN